LQQNNLKTSKVQILDVLQKLKKSRFLGTQSQQKIVAFQSN